MEAVREVPLRLGRYEIVERLAAGGMGEVFVARAFGAGGFIKPVALKRIHPHLADNISFIHMLHDEARLAASIHHPNIVATIDVGSEGNDHFVVLDFVSGDPLSRMLRELKKRKKNMPTWVAAWVGAQIASALHAAHDAKTLAGERMEIVHRDVSLANIMLSDAGHPMLFDFGVAKAKQRMVETSHGELKGKLAYMAPETFHGVAVDRTVDVYSLGVVLYELLTGKSPYQRASDLETISALTRAEAPPPSTLRREVDASFDAIVMRGMARERASRFRTAAELEHALRDWARAHSMPHDAAAVADWLARSFPERLEARAALLARVAQPGEVTDIGPPLALLDCTPVSGPVSNPRAGRTPLSNRFPAGIAGGTPPSIRGGTEILVGPAGLVTSTPPPSATHSGITRPTTGAHAAQGGDARPRRSWLPVLGALAGAAVGVIGVVVLLGGQPDASLSARPASEAAAEVAPAAAPTAPTPEEPVAPAAASAAPVAEPGSEEVAAPVPTSAPRPATPPRQAKAPPTKAAAPKPTAKGKGPLVREYE